MLKQSKKVKMAMAIEEHGDNLNRIFKTDIDSNSLCKKLFRIEQKAHREAERYCNGEIETVQWEDIATEILNKVDKILRFREKNIPVFFNADPRGYALKIKDDYIREHSVKIYRDWGGIRDYSS
jgi:hypothetical protein